MIIIYLTCVTNSFTINGESRPTIQPFFSGAVISRYKPLFQGKKKKKNLDVASKLHYNRWLFEQ